MTTTSKLRLLKSKLRSHKADPEWQRLAEMPEPARTSPHRPYWVCARFLVAMHSLRTCSRLVKQDQQKEGIYWGIQVVGLGQQALNRRNHNGAHFDVYVLADSYLAGPAPVELTLLVPLRDQLVREAEDHWDYLSDAEQTVLAQIANAGDVGMRPSELAALDSLPGFKTTYLNRHGDKVIRSLRDRHLIAPKGKARGCNVHYMLVRRPAGWPFK